MPEVQAFFVSGTYASIELFNKVSSFENQGALLHKPICKGFFSDIIFKRRSLHKIYRSINWPAYNRDSFIAEI